MVELKVDPGTPPAAGVAAAASPQGASTFKPTKPIRGGLVQVGPDIWVP